MKKNGRDIRLWAFWIVDGCIALWIDARYVWCGVVWWSRFDGISVADFNVSCGLAALLLH